MSDLVWMHRLHLGVLALYAIGFGVIFCLPTPVHASSRPKECIYVDGNVAMLRLQLPVATFNTRPPRLLVSPKEFAFQECSASWIRPLVRENEYPVLVRQNITLMSVEGDICAKVPKFIIYNARQGLDAIYANGVTEPMQQRIAAALAVTMKLCDKQPEELQFVARKVEAVEQSLLHRARSGTLKRGETVPFVITDFYSGRVFPRKNLQIVADDPAQEAAYWAERGRRADAAYDAAENRRARQALGAFLGTLIMGAALDSCDPTAAGCP